MWLYVYLCGHATSVHVVAARKKTNDSVGRDVKTVSSISVCHIARNIFVVYACHAHCAREDVLKCL